MVKQMKRVIAAAADCKRSSREVTTVEKSLGLAVRMVVTGWWWCLSRSHWRKHVS
jgi:hypothetical protein